MTQRLGAEAAQAWLTQTGKTVPAGTPTATLKLGHQALGSVLPPTVALRDLVTLSEPNFLDCFAKITDTKAHCPWLHITVRQDHPEACHVWSSSPSVSSTGSSVKAGTAERSLGRYVSSLAPQRGCLPTHSPLPPFQERTENQISLKSKQL